MGIRKNKTVVPADDVQEDVADTPQDIPEQEESTEVATTTAAAPPAVTTGAAPTIRSLENALDARQFGNLFPRVVGSNGLVCKKDRKSTPFGDFIDVQVISTSERWMVTPDAEQTDVAARKLCRASYDGLNIPGWKGEPDIPIEEYNEEIIAAGYEPNPLGCYKDIFCSIFNADKNLDYALNVGLVQVSVSPTSIKSLDGYLAQVKFKVAAGTVLKTHQNCLRIVGVSVSGDTTYTVTDFEPVPLEVAQAYTPVLDED
jgi:hypothetical protein